MKKKQFRPNSEYVRYRDGIWIECRKRIYLYWFKFLRHAEESSEHKVNWRKYQDWGGRDAVMNMKFDDWWQEHWKHCFGIDEEKGRARYMVSKRHKADGVRYALLCYENQHRGSNWDIAIHIQKEEMRKRYFVPSFTNNNVGYSIQKIDGKFEHIPINPFDLEGMKTKTRLTRKSARESGEKGVRVFDEESRTNYKKDTREIERIEDGEIYENREVKRRIQGYVSRYLKQAKSHLENVAQGKF